MDSLISRQAAIDGKITAVISGQAIEAIPVSYIKKLPSAQPEIIYCKDCLYWIPGYITDQDDFIPSKCGKYQQMVGHSGDDYCSYAERKDDE